MAAVNKAIEALLSQENILNDETLCITMQGRLNDANYSINFKDHGCDGAIGSKTCQDIVDFCRDNPAALVTMNPDLLQKIFGYNDFRQQLTAIVDDNPQVKAQLYGAAQTALNNKGLEQLSSAELKNVQARWALTGDYTKTIDGVSGSGTEAAYSSHTAKIGSGVENIASTAEPDTTTVNYNRDVSTAGIMPAVLKTRPLLIVDLGHGTGAGRKGIGLDVGASYVDASGARLDETTFVDPVGASLKQFMEAQGWDVQFTRNPHEYTDNYLSPLERGEMTAEWAKGRQHVAMVSLHVDSARSDYEGPRVYVASSDNADGKVDYGRSAINSESLALGGAIESSLSLEFASTRSNTADFRLTQVFDDTTQHGAGISASVLIEIGNMTGQQNRATLEQMRDNPHQMAALIAKGVIDHHTSIHGNRTLLAKTNQPPLPGVHT